MSRNRTFVGLDVGTTKTCAVIGQEYRGAQLHILGVGTAPSYGLKGGQVVDVVLTVKAIDEAIFRAEKVAKLRASQVVTGIAGGHLQSHSQQGQVHLPSNEREVRERHVGAVVRGATLLSLSEDREVVAVIPKTFATDHLTDVLDPRGLTARQLSVEAHVVTGATNAMANLERCVDQAGLSTQGRVLQPLASARACLTPEQRREGVVLIDIGGGTTDVALFVDDACWHIAVLPVGGALVTADIARGLRLPTKVAEALKVEHGSVAVPPDDHAATVAAPGFDHGAPVAVRRRDLSEVVSARVEELLHLVRDEITRSGYYDFLPAGAVLTGGGSRMAGLRNLASEILDMPVTMGQPRALWGLGENLRVPEFSTGIGLVLTAAAAEEADGWVAGASRRQQGVLDRLGGWMRSVVSPSTG
ncbi:MAG: cell division protein FtsA [Chloroflexi bacterium]|nr:cell division protein FtsA [Chloroflexota bacterium]MCY3958793.1 cell division protein FtsA [Chloroflexota bacterium]